MIQDYWNIIVYVTTIIFSVGVTISRINALEKEVQKHNGLIDRTYRLEADVKQIVTRIDNIDSDIERIEREREHNGQR